MKTVILPSGEAIPALGLGTWRFGESTARRGAEVAAVRQALQIGYRLIDTAEMYGEGGAEKVVGQALREAFAAGEVRREEVFLVSKVYPHHADRRGIEAACARSLARLGVETLDLYLLHWRGAHPLADSVAGFRALQAAGRIRHWGVSNFDRTDLLELAGIPGGEAVAANQVWYSAGHRGVEFELLPAMRERGLPLMAYSPIDQAALTRHAALRRLAAERGLSAAQVALAWTLRDGGVVAIPKAGRAEHLRENLAATDVVLDAGLLSALDAALPPPSGPVPLAMN